MSTGGFSTARLGRMHDVMARYIERGEVPGLVSLVSRRGEAHVDVLGTMAAGGGAPPPAAIVPSTSTCASPRRLTSETRPGTSPRSI